MPKSAQPGPVVRSRDSPARRPPANSTMSPSTTTASGETRAHRTVRPRGAQARGRAAGLRREPSRDAAKRSFDKGLRVLVVLFREPRRCADNATLDPTDPRYAWTDQGLVTQSFPTDDYNAIDPSL